ncbi:MAG: ImmA/IrrE family metallo-endopeptidase [Planctomycetes bacterium]|nr:ImmA/IrrE family metallo-endopeptidase [Planctomycetota bacterium]
MFDELPREDVTATIDAMIDELLDAAGITQPPIDAIALAQSQLDIVIVVDQRQPQRGRAQRIVGKKQIYLKPEPREERHQWTVAHEIGEHLKAELFSRLGIDPSQAKAMAGESLANLFAYRLLVPTRCFVEDVKRFDYDLLALKKRYPTSSHEVIAMRFLDLPAPCVVTIIDNERITRRRSNAVRTKRELTPIEERCWRHVAERGEPASMRDDHWAVSAWPIHELEWRREVLRSVPMDSESL